jgi:sensor histidine kinase YesM
LPGTVNSDFINIEFNFEKNGWLSFNLENNYEEPFNPKKSNSGIGLQNVKQRLKLLYQPNEYKLNIYKKEHIHLINLELKLK